MTLIEMLVAIMVICTGTLATLFGQTAAQGDRGAARALPGVERTMRVTVVVVAVDGNGRVSKPVRLSTVSDPASVLPGVAGDTALAVRNATESALATVRTLPTLSSPGRCGCSTSAAARGARSAPSDHSTRDTSQAGLTCTVSGPAPTLMGLEAIAGSAADVAHAVRGVHGPELRRPAGCRPGAGMLNAATKP